MTSWMTSSRYAVLGAANGAGLAGCFGERERRGGDRERGGRGCGGQTRDGDRGAGPGLVWAWGSGLSGLCLALPLVAVLQHVTEVGLGHH